MSRGAKPGERRGGRQKGTPNKKTALIKAAFAGTASNPDMSPLDFFLTDDGLGHSLAGTLFCNRARTTGSPFCCHSRPAGTVALLCRSRQWPRSQPSERLAFALMWSVAQDARLKAAECEKRAATAPDAETRRLYVGLAKQWRVMVRQGEQLEANLRELAREENKRLDSLGRRSY